MASSQPKHIVIAIHGFRGTHHGFDFIRDAFFAISPKNSATFEWFIPDLPGFGDGPDFENTQPPQSHKLKDGMYSPSHYTQWLDQYIADIRAQNPDSIIDLVGHSFGSIVCAAYMAEYTGIRKLLLISPISNPALKGPKKFVTLGAVVFYKIGAILPQSIARSWLSSWWMIASMNKIMTRSHDPAIIARVKEQHGAHFSTFHSAQSLLKIFETSIRHSVADFAPKITIPIRFIIGAGDEIAPLSSQKKVVSQCQNASITVIPHVGHLPHYETPEAIADTIYEWISEE